MVHFFCHFNGASEGFRLHSGERAFSNYRSVQKNNVLSKWDITHDTNDNIFMMSPHAAPLWFGADIIGLGCQSRGYY